MLTHFLPAPPWKYPRPSLGPGLGLGRDVRHRDSRRTSLVMFPFQKRELRLRRVASGQQVLNLGVSGAPTSARTQGLLGKLGGLGGEVWPVAPGGKLCDGH